MNTPEEVIKQETAALAFAAALYAVGKLLTIIFFLNGSSTAHMPLIYMALSAYAMSGAMLLVIKCGPAKTQT